MSRPSFIGHWSSFLGKDDSTYTGSDEKMSIGAPIGRRLGLTKLGIHVEILPPGRRTSWPHAEELEEEFVFVLEGHPDAWIDGHLHALVPGDMVAFPAGTGIAHTILNNTETEVRLLVGGDARIAENGVVYPLHPARNAECAATGHLWKDAPERELGPHDGVPRVRDTSGATGDAET